MPFPKRSELRYTRWYGKGWEKKRGQPKEAGTWDMPIEPVPGLPLVGTALMLPVPLWLKTRADLCHRCMATA